MAPTKPAKKPAPKKKPAAPRPTKAPASSKAKPAPKPKLGRPPKKPSERRADRVILRLTAAELASIRAAASAAGEPVSTWIVHVAFLASRKSP